MKKWFQISLNKVFVFALLLLITLNVLAAIFQNSLIFESTKPLFVPIFLIFYFIKNKLSDFNNTKLSDFIKNKLSEFIFILFLLSSFLGDTVFTFISDNAIEKSSNLMYFIGYICLIAIIISKFDFSKFNFYKIDKVIGVYLVLMLLINVYFLFVLYSVLKANIADNTEVLVFALKSASIITLLFLSFGVYLAKESTSSLLFLMLGLCFLFSDILNYIDIYYIFDWRFAILDRVLHAVGLFFLFNYMLKPNESIKSVSVKEKIMPSKIYLLKQ